MRGLGTIINIILIVLAGTFGCSFSSKMKEKMQETLFLVTGVAVIFIGIAGAMEQMLCIENGRLSPRNIMMVICCLAIGAIVGEHFDLDGKINQFADYVKTIQSLWWLLSIQVVSYVLGRWQSLVQSKME